jgi:hypothetical protein
MQTNTTKIARGVFLLSFASGLHARTDTSDILEAEHSKKAIGDKVDYY